MEPNQNMAGAPNQDVVVKPASEQNAIEYGADGEKKGGKGMMIGMILCLLLAVGGIGFGVWAMMDGGAQMVKKDEQIASLSRQLEKESHLVAEEYNEVVDERGGEVYKNPVIRSDSDEIFYSLGFQSSYILNGDSVKRVSIGIKDGKVSNCSLMERISDVSWQEIGECSIGGLDGNIYKVVEFGQGQDNGENRIGFIMESGKVGYFRLYDLGINSSVNISSYLNIDGYVVDALEIGVGNGVAGGYGSTVFVLKDGSFVKYDETMIQ